jgi:hypothetical protein
LTRIINDDQRPYRALVHSFCGKDYRFISLCRIDISNADTTDGHRSFLAKRSFSNQADDPLLFGMQI